MAIQRKRRGKEKIVIELRGEEGDEKMVKEGEKGRR